MKTFHLILNAAVSSALAAILVFANATGTQPSTNLAIDFTNKGETQAYIHWTLPAGLTSSPSSVNFGTVNVGSQSSINLVITNDGAALIQLQPISIAGQNASDFSVLSQCTAYLDPAAQCTMVITFKPSAAGPRSATLSIPFAGVGLNPASMQITITKLEPPSDVKATLVTR
jgi:hypothetical protein